MIKKIDVKVCKYCKKEVEKLNRGYCSNICKNFDKDLQRQSDLTGIEGEDYIINLWSGLKCLQINSQYIKGRWPDKSIQDYKNEFPNAPLQSGNMIKRATKNSGKHMKEEKYRKMFSEKFKGENNPNHKSKTTSEERKSRSPFSKAFYLRENPNLSEEELQKKVNDFVSEALKDRLLPNQKEYWIDKGFSQDEAIELVKDRQRTFTLEKCIEKYGKEEGVKVFKTRNEKWSKLMEEKYRNGEYSKAPLTLNNSRVSSIQLEFYEDLKLYIDDIECEFEIIDLPNRYYYDFVLNKRIIEFNGDFWHCNPELYESNFKHPITKNYANEIWKRDELKTQIAHKNGYDVLVVWETEYLNNPKEVIDKCVKYLTDKL